MHVHFIEDENGDIVDARHYCSDWCNRADNDDDYQGFNGCHESEFNRECDACGATIHGADGPYPG
jgi:hypothetical protein